MYAKLINGELQIAPKKLIIDDIQVWNASEADYLSKGWKPVVRTNPPEPEPGFCYVASWKETAKKISVVWTKVEAPDIVSDSEALAELLEVIG